MVHDKLKRALAVRFKFINSQPLERLQFRSDDMKWQK